MRSSTIYAFTLLFVCILSLIFSTAAQREPTRSWPDFDACVGRQLTLDAPPAAAVSGERQAPPAAVSAHLLRERPRVQLRWSSLTDAPSRVFSFEQALTAPSRDDAETNARRFLKTNDELFRLSAAEIDDLRVARRYRTEHNGLTHLTLQQQVGGVEIFQSDYTFHFDRDGALLAANGELLPNAAQAVRAAKAKLTALAALRLAVDYAGVQLRGAVEQVAAPTGNDARQTLRAETDFERPVEARLVYFPLAAQKLRPAWELTLWLRSSPDVYWLLLDAENGALLYRQNLTQYETAQQPQPHGPVYLQDSPRPDNPHTSNAPPVVARQDVPFNGAPYFAANDRHFDWWAGQAVTGLISNNTDTRLDRDANNAADLPRLTVTDGNFIFPIDLTVAPTTADNQRAALVNVFYWVNRYHDALYSFGFNEAAGNFQRDNFGLGGAGNDAVLADAQDGSGINNANFSTPRDGGAGRMQMYLWSGNPQLDGDLDQGIIIHELTHGLSNRLVNGGGGGLTGTQAGGMGEGWSDYFGLVLLRKESDDLDGSYAVGQYAFNNYTRGIRRAPYSTDLRVFPFTFKDITRNPEVHAVGEIWCNALLEMRAGLIRRLGYQEGQRQSLQLVVDGLKLTPATPSFIDARNAILLADRVNNGGANQCVIWQAFAKRGLGLLAAALSTNDTQPIESYDATSFCSDRGTLAFDRPGYVVGEQIKLSLGDRNAAAPVRIRVRSTVTGDEETVTLAAHNVFAGSFSANVNTAAGRAVAGDGVLQASLALRDKVLVVYEDANAGSGNPAQITAQAEIAGEATVFADDIERGNRGWSVAGTPGTWNITTARALSPTHSWTDGPAGSYANNVDAALVSPLLDLSQAAGAVLVFAHSYDLETNADFALVEFSNDDGATWQRAAIYSGTTSTTMTQTRINLDALSGQARARIRFRLVTDESVTRDGWYVDDIRVVARTSDPALLPINTAPTIASLSPAFGAPGTTNRVTMLGANFTERADTRVFFGGTAATIDNVAEGVLSVTAPALPAGTATVRVENRNGAAVLVNGFTLYTLNTSAPKPALTGIFPSSGTTRGGTTVTLTGANFTPSTTVTFGGENATNRTFVNSSTLRAVTPAAKPDGQVGAVEVAVGNPTSEKAMLAGGFSYTAPTPPTVRVLSPNGGERAFVGATITLHWQSSDNRALGGHRLELHRSAGPLLPALQKIADIALDLPAEAQSFNWTIPASVAASNLYRLRVIALDDEGAQSDAYGSGDFTIGRRWESATALPTAVQRPATAGDGRYLYVIGGRTTGASSSTVSAVRRFDPDANPPAWTTQTPLPIGLNGGDAAFLGGKIYVPGGINPQVEYQASHYVYDPAANAWTTAAAPPADTFLYALAVDEQRGVYYFTGGIGFVGQEPLNNVRVYDPRSNAWSELPPMQTARFTHEAVVINGKLYVTGGDNGSGALASSEVYDFDTRQWSAIAPLNQPRRYALNGAARDEAGRGLWIVAGGENGAALGNAEAYDVAANRWIVLDGSFNLTTPRTALGGAALGGFLYAVGGGTIAGTGTTNFTTSERLGQIVTALGTPNQPPLVLTPPAQVGFANRELSFTVTAHDLGSGAPLNLAAEGLPPGANFNVVNDTNNNARGTFRWTPAAAEVGRSFVVNFTASDGQLSDVKSVALRVVNATALAAVNAADFRLGPLTPDGIASIFGTNLAARMETAAAQPLPTILGGATVTINGAAAQLFFASPTQINFVVPSNVGAGAATIVVSNATGGFAVGTVEIVASSPALFTTNASGRGDAVAQATADGVNFQAPPFDVTVHGRPNVLVLYGTGLRHAAANNPGDADGVAETVTATVGGLTARVLFAGAQGSLTGLDQLNVEFPAGLAGGGERRVEVALTVNSGAANRVTVLIR